MMDIRQVADHLEIEQVLYRYCRAIDRGEVDLLKSVYHDDALDAHGAFQGLAHKFADKIVAQMDEIGLIGQHMISNILIELDGDRADVESYFQAFHPARDPDGNTGHAFVCGRYLDLFERREDIWKIADRKVIFDLSHAPQMPPAWSSGANYPSGQRRSGDLSHERFRSLGGSRRRV